MLLPFGMLVLTTVFLFALVASVDASSKRVYKVYGSKHVQTPNLIVVVCPEGYERLDDGACYKVVTKVTTVLDAARQCEKSGGRLAEIPSFEVNNRLAHKSEQKNMTLGMICTGTKITSCTYITGEDLTADSYTNFAPGHPNPENGTCVYLKTWGDYTNYWLSGDCVTENGYICQKTGREKINACGSGYTKHNGKCYKIIQEKLNATEAHKACSAHCGSVVHIDSPEENEFVRALASYGNNDEVWTGMNLTKMITWKKEKENTMTFLKDYQNFGHLHLPLGECLIVALNDEFVQKGQWMNKNCAKKVQSVCERRIENPCAEDTRGPDAEEGMTFKGKKGLESYYRNQVVGGGGTNRFYRSFNEKTGVHQYQLDPVSSYDNGWQQQGDIGYYMNESTYSNMKQYCPLLKKLLTQHSREVGWSVFQTSGTNNLWYMTTGPFYCAPELNYCGANFELVRIDNKKVTDYFYPKSLEERQKFLEDNDYSDKVYDTPCYIWQPDQTAL